MRGRESPLLQYLVVHLRDFHDCPDELLEGRLLHYLDGFHAGLHVEDGFGQVGKHTDHEEYELAKAAQRAWIMELLDGAMKKGVAG